MSAFAQGILFGVFGLVLGVGVGLGGWLLWRQQRRWLELNQGLTRLNVVVGGLGKGTATLERRVGQLEQRVQELRRRLELLEGRQRASRPYDEAIRLVRQGARAQRLVEELGLSPGEAELLIMLHGGDKPPAS